ncbi:MAG TPA: hypothetical protein VHA33_21890 [Candidatus Angelobacter sp.]|jgi:plastocyanin|nr:hypothetical protein [Candidatus Angelobacter sp.]
MKNTFNIAVTDKLGELVPEPSSVEVKTGDTVVWNYDGSKKFYVSFSPFNRYESGGENGHQSLELPVVTEFSSPARYDIGQVGPPDSSSSGGVIITCSTCPPGD